MMWIRDNDGFTSVGGSNESRYVENPANGDLVRYCCGGRECVSTKLANSGSKIPTAWNSPDPGLPRVKRHAVNLSARRLSWLVEVARR